MKQFLLLLTLSVIIFSCNNDGDPGDKDDSIMKVSVPENVSQEDTIALRNSMEQVYKGKTIVFEIDR